MALKFLNKKGWHTGSLRNVETVWKAEQKHEAELKKVEELRKQIHVEREAEDLRRLREEAGLAPKQERLEFLYDSGHAVKGVGSETEFVREFAPDRKVEVEVLKGVGKQVAPASPVGALFQDQGPISSNDKWRKLHTDPLVLIKQQELAALSRIRQNPVKLEMIRKDVEMTREKEEKKLRKEEKKRKKRDKEEEDDRLKHEKHKKNRHRRVHDGDSREGTPPKKREGIGGRSRNRVSSSSPPRRSQSFGDKNRKSRHRSPEQTDSSTEIGEQMRHSSAHANSVPGMRHRKRHSPESVDARRRFPDRVCHSVERGGSSPRFSDRVQYMPELPGSSRKMSERPFNAAERSSCSLKFSDQWRGSPNRAGARDHLKDRS